MSTWTYRQATGELRDPDGVLVEVGYSGAPGYVNRPMAERRENQGPVPTGGYAMLAAYDHPNLGPCSIPLEPAPDNRMHGRDDFFVHGDTPEMDQSASEGCIIMSRPTRDLLAASAVRDLTVTI